MCAACLPRGLEQQSAGPARAAPQRAPGVHHLDEVVTKAADLVLELGFRVFCQLLGVGVSGVRMLWSRLLGSATHPSGPQVSTTSMK